MELAGKKSCGHDKNAREMLNANKIRNAKNQLPLKSSW